MPGFYETLDIGIGLLLVLVLLSLLATWIQEVLATLLNWRSKELVNIIQNLLDPPTGKLEGIKALGVEWPEGVNEDVAEKLKKNAVKTFYEHPVVQALTKPDELPPYISAQQFGTVLFDLFTRAGMEGDPTTPRKALKALKEGIQKLENPSTKEALLAVVKAAEAGEVSAEEKIAAARRGIEAWFDGTMERATDWYKRTAQWRGLVIGIVLAIAFNADTIGLAQTLWEDSALRATYSAAAVAVLEKGKDLEANDALEELKKLDLPIGWSSRNLPGNMPVGWIWKVVGWLITGFAVSQGSPFWFDLLGRFVNIRGTGKRPEPAAAGGS